jgi:hypothetical protein
MAEGEIQLPPNSTGSIIRTQLGDDTTTEIPNDEMQEVVTLADRYGFLPGDRRQSSTMVYSEQLEETNQLLGKILTTLQLAFKL